MRTSRQHERENFSRGSAMVMALIAISILAMIAAAYMKRATIFNRATYLTDHRYLLQRTLVSEADRIRDMITQRVNEIALPNAIAPDVDLATTDANNTLAFANFVRDFERTYNESSQHTTHNRTLSIECVSQMTMGLTRMEGCTKFRKYDPKFFRMRLSQYIPEEQMLLNLDQEFSIKRTTLNDYAYLLTGATQDVRLGEVKFTEPVGIFFDPSVVTSVNGIIFSSESGNGTEILKVLITNLGSAQSPGDSQRYLIQNARAKFTLASILFGESPAQFLDAINQQFDRLRLHPGTINAVDPNTGRTPGEAKVYQVCENLQASDASKRCEISRIGSPRYEIDASGNLEVIDLWGWTLLNNADGSVIVAGTNSHTDPSIGNGPFSDLIYSGPQIPGRIYYLPGTAWVRGSSETPLQAESPLYERQTFMADQFIIKNSLVSNDSRKNTALFAHGDISLSMESEDPDLAFIFNVNGSPKTLDQLKRVQMNYGNSTTSVKLHASIVPGSSGSFSIPTAFMDGNIWYGGNPRTLGKMESRGLIVSKTQTITSVLQFIVNQGAYRPSGFTSLTMSAQGLEYPPPGMNFAINSNLQSLLNASTFNATDIGEALKSVDHP